MSAAKSADVLRVESYREWHGHLTLDNAEAVHARIVGLLGGGRRHATAHYMADDHRPPRLRTGMEARIEFRQPTAEDRYALITIADHAGVVFLATKAADGATARDMPTADRPPWLKLTWDRVEISDHVPAGTAAYTVYAVEESNPNAVKVDSGSAVVGGKVITETAAQPAAYLVARDAGSYLEVARSWHTEGGATIDAALFHGEGWAVYAAYPVGGGS